MDECHKLLTNKVDLYNPKGHQIQRNIYEPLPLGGPQGQVTIQPQFFFNRDLDSSIWTGDKERRIAVFYRIKLKALDTLTLALKNWFHLCGLKVNANMTSVRSMASLTGGLEERNSTSTNTVSPLIVKQSDRRCEFSM
ncbi:hypothetical protein Tco_1287376 [Tanacetum coccineum]